MKEPTKFKTQREAYWYRQGLKDSKKSINSTLDSDIKRYSLDFLDHLPEGDNEISAGEKIRKSLSNLRGRL